MSDGDECTCAAWHESECACDADWTTQEVYDLQKEVKQLRENIAAITFTSVDTSQVTCFEVIDHTARNSLRAIVRYNVNVELLYQDNGSTLKVVLSDRKENEDA